MDIKKEKNYRDAKGLGLLGTRVISFLAQLSRLLYKGHPVLLCGCDLSFLKTVYGLEVNLFIYFFRGEF